MLSTCKGVILGKGLLRKTTEDDNERRLIGFSNTINIHFQRFGQDRHDIVIN